MKLTINGQEQTFAPTTLALLIEQLGMKQDRVAVELNREGPIKRGTPLVTSFRKSPVDRSRFAPKMCQTFFIHNV